MSQTCTQCGFPMDTPERAHAFIHRQFEALIEHRKAVREAEAYAELNLRWRRYGERLQLAMLELKERTRPHGDMADAPVNALVKKALLDAFDAYQAKSESEIGTGTNQRQGADSPASATTDPSGEQDKARDAVTTAAPPLNAPLATPGAQSAPATTSNGWHRIATVEGAVLWKCPRCKRETWADEKAPPACGCLAVGTGYDALNELSKRHGEVFDLAVEFRDTLCRTLDKAEIYGRQGKPLPQDEIDAMTARLADTTERLYGPGRQVPPHRSGGGGQIIPSQGLPSEDARDAARYRYLRVDDHWGEDAGPDFHGSAWGVLGELSGSEFDAFIDERMSHAQCNQQEKKP